ncbi:HAD family hydrolase [Halorarius halobius]|uniref:HAD family hydrolase n=1 Tax=Halorarius halobius TaxID=2962671 RepID=UPI0020CC56B4|nr:HAD-IA family hydrolase [Halorarius halobius]
MTYDALLFDHDGVLLRVDPGDRERFHDAVREAFAAVGADPDAEDVRELVYGVSPEQVQAVADRYGVDPEAFWRARDEHCSRVQRRAIDAGEKRLYDDVDALAALDRPLGVVSTNQQATLEHVVETFGDRLPAFESVHGRPPTIRSLRRKKPNPHYLERALDALDATRALYVGDSPHDVEAAHAAGLDAAFLRREHNADVEPDRSPEYELQGLEEIRTIAGEN